MYPCKDVPSVSLHTSQALEDAAPLFSVLQLSLGKKLSPGSSGRCTNSRVTEPHWRSFPLPFFPENTNGFRWRSRHGLFKILQHFSGSGVWGSRRTGLCPYLQSKRYNIVYLFHKLLIRLGQGLGFLHLLAVLPSLWSSKGTVCNQGCLGFNGWMFEPRGKNVCCLYMYLYNYKI